jgi:hypothetical protein
MSGYNKTTGLFDLTQTKASHWLRRTDFPAECRGKEGMAFVAALLRALGYEVPTVRSNWLSVKANPDQLWEALSGEPSDPAASEHYYRNASTDLPRKPKPRGSTLLSPEEAASFQRGVDGCGKPTAVVAASGQAVCRACGNKIAKGVLCLIGCYDQFGDGDLIKKCYVHQTCEKPEGPLASGPVPGTAHDRGDGFVVLSVPFEDKDWAKGLGSVWDGQAKAWTAKAGRDFPAFERWLPKPSPQVVQPQ